VKWQEDTAFVDWLVQMNYARTKEGKIKPITSLGLVLYMYEAWSAGKDEANKPAPVVCQCDVCMGLKEKNGSLLAG